MPKGRVKKNRHTSTILLISIKVDKGRGGWGGQRMWINNSLVRILLTSGDVDKGGGFGKMLIHKCG